ncbi:MAG: DUF3143 domain-containing protein [Oscillatoria sp. PMC 1068.18]|nr:DUF3143 domain-containing protein [Oscillatoria sp. PMC 1076.18]MEC4988085.1 DUF3143 domain-containing protein [Oscillatoria sp. PMC 1068.18]
MALPSTDTPLYNHPLPEIEQWLINQGCAQDSKQPHCWHIEKPEWQAEICLEIEEITVRYANIDSSNREISRSFKYSLSREDIEAAVFGGP